MKLLAHCLSGFTKAPLQLQCYQQSELIKREIKAFSLNVCVCGVSESWQIATALTEATSFFFSNHQLQYLDKLIPILYISSGDGPHQYTFNCIKCITLKDTLRGEIFPLSMNS